MAWQDKSVHHFLFKSPALELLTQKERRLSVVQLPYLLIGGRAELAHDGLRFGLFIL